MMPVNICFATGAGPQIGFGHLSRCLSLAHLLRDLFEVHFVVDENTHSAMTAMGEINEALKVHILKAEQSAAEAISSVCQPGEVVVLDGYEYGEQLISSLRQNKLLVAYIDDMVVTGLSADMFINHCGGIRPEEFKSDPLAFYCLGPEYALLRPAFTDHYDSEISYDVLVAFGGSDPDNQTLKTLTTLDPQFKTAVLLGPAFAFTREIEVHCESKANTKIFKSLGAEQLAVLMAQCKNAVLSASVISYEFLAASHGKLYVIQTADNQTRFYRFLTEQGLARPFRGNFDSSFEPTRALDGHSVRRLRTAFQSLILQNEAIVRIAAPGDVNLVFDWVNDPDVRKQSYHSDPIERSVHEKWFSSASKAPNIRYYIIESAGKAVGQIRFNISKSVATISYLVDPDHRGQGWGDRILRLGVKRLLTTESGISRIVGYVKQDNHASFNSFIKCNFTESATEKYPDSVLFTLKCKNENR